MNICVVPVEVYCKYSDHIGNSAAGILFFWLVSWVFIWAMTYRVQIFLFEEIFV